MKKLILFLLLMASATINYGQQKTLAFTSTDTALENAFGWAKKMALHYQGNPGDPVGPWYESALPPRYAFCMRDVSHQSIGAEILSMGKENKNMFTVFAKNISENKDWRSYWEINKFGKPAPADYRNDKAFWYNLNANFDLLNACWKLYLWTGDKTYINAPVFANFHKRTVDDFITSWVLQADSLLTRPAHPNAPIPFNETDAFHRCRGLPSYSEGVLNIRLGIDLVAAIYRGLLSYSAILKLNGNEKEAALFTQKAIAYQQHIDTHWWDNSAEVYNTYYDNAEHFGKNEGETFLLWFDALKDSVRTSKTIEQVMKTDNNVENLSYQALLFYKYGFWNNAYENILHLANPATARNEYPEVSFGVIEGIVQGLMGVDADADNKRVSTIFRNSGNITATITNVPVLNTFITVKHTGPQQTEFTNNGKKTVVWRAGFSGSFDKVDLNRQPAKLSLTIDNYGKLFSYTDILVAPGKKAIVSVK